jgi:hypothetical protein
VYTRGAQPATIEQCQRLLYSKKTVHPYVSTGMLLSCTVQYGYACEHVHAGDQNSLQHCLQASSTLPARC